MSNFNSILLLLLSYHVANEQYGILCPINCQYAGVFSLKLHVKYEMFHTLLLKYMS